MSVEVSDVSVVDVPAARILRWIDNFVARHGARTPSPDGRQHAEDGSWFCLRSAFSAEPVLHLDGDSPGPDLPAEWAVVLVRRGGYAVARMHGDELVASKVGSRHVQGRTKAGGQSQQRFARRRANQAREAWSAATDHAARVLDGLAGPVVTGGDQEAVDEVFSDPRLAHLSRVPHPGHVPEPRRAALDAVIASCLGWRVSVHNAPRPTR